jgi:prolyl-tRNA synthetase
LNASIVEVNNLDDFIKAITDRKIVKAPWGGDASQEKELQQQTGATPRCIIESISNKTCFFTKKPATHMVYFARAY